jgi:hypothetical protein
MDELREPHEPAEPAVDRVIVDGDHEWIVRVEGRATARAGSSMGTPLLLLTFAKAKAPDVRVRETVLVGRRLDGLSESELIDALAVSRRFRKDWDPKDLFKGTRRAKHGG